MLLDTILFNARLDAVPAEARRLEETGYAGLWTAETGRTPFFPLALAAEHTERVTLGTAIAVAFPRSPFVVAQYAWELQELSKGRFVLGLGTQVKAHNERRFSVPFDRPGPRLREMIHCLHAIWASFRGAAPLEFRGEFFRHDLITPFFSPGPIDQPDPPIYVAAVNEWMYRMAGEVADGVHLHPLHTLRYLEERTIPALKGGLSASGRSRSDITLVVPVFAVATDDADTERSMAAMIRQQIAFYGSTRTYRGVFEIHGWGDVPRQLHELVARQQWARLGDVITDEMLEHFAVVGEWKDIPDLVKRKYGGVADRVILYAGAGSGDTEREVVRAFNG